MTNVIRVFPAIKRAALEIAYDNGFIHRNAPELEYIREVDKLLQELPFMKLAELNAWLVGLDPHRFQIACTGEESEMEEVIKTSPDPEFTHSTLNLIFGEPE